MADISDVKEDEIKDLWQSLEDLSCELNHLHHLNQR